MTTIEELEKTIKTKSKTLNLAVRDNGRQYREEGKMNCQNICRCLKEELMKYKKLNTRYKNF